VKSHLNVKFELTIFYFLSYRHNFLCRADPSTKSELKDTMSGSDEFEHEQGNQSLSSESASLSVGTENNHAGGLSDDSSLTIARAETEAVNERESAVKQRLHLRWSSGSRVIARAETEAANIRESAVK
jgi:hypothetical protein